MSKAHKKKKRKGRPRIKCPNCKYSFSRDEFSMHSKYCKKRKRGIPLPTIFKKYQEKQ